MPDNPTSSLPLVAAPLLAGAAVLVFGPLVASVYTRPVVFGLVCLCVVLELVAIGWLLKKRLAGVIIGQTNCMSLSKLQMCAWTVLVLAAISTAAAFNVADHVTALDIKIPPELLVAMGISATSLVAAPAVLSLKSVQTPAPSDLATAANKLTGDPGGAVPNSGKVMGNVTPTDASVTDLFTGDEVANFDSPDLGKIQQFLITLMLVGVYAATICGCFARVGPTKTLPPIDPGFIWLMGVSHASYLASKATPKVANSQPPAAGGGGNGNGG